MNPYLLVLALGLAALFQVSFLPALAIGGVTPNLMLVVVVGWGLLRGIRPALTWALIGGLALDLLAGGPFGSYTLSLAAAASVSGLGSDIVFRSHLILPLAIVALATLAQAVVQLLVLLATGHSLLPTDTLVRLLLIETAYNTLLMLLLYPLLAWLSRVTGRERLALE